MGRLVIETRPPDFQYGVQAQTIRSTQFRAVDENRTRVSLCLGKAMCTSSYTTTALLSRAANQNRTGILCLEDRRTNRCAIAANYKFEVTIHKWIIAANLWSHLESNKGLWIFSSAPCLHGLKDSNLRPLVLETNATTNWAKPVFRSPCRNRTCILRARISHNIHYTKGLNLMYSKRDSNL